jgi:hypothetical protein
MATPTIRITRLGALALGIAVAALAAGCSSSSSGSTTTTKAAPATTTTGAAGGTASVSNLSTRLANGKGLTYSATYTVTSPTESGTLTAERMPPGSSRFDVTFQGKQAVVINTPSTTYVCDLAKSPAECVTGAPDPAAGLEELIDPNPVISELQASAAAGRKAVTFSSQTVAGQPSTCATITSPPHPGTFCVTEQGILASVTASNGSIVLTSFTTDVPASDFAPPAGATITSVPAGTP